MSGGAHNSDTSGYWLHAGYLELQPNVGNNFQLMLWMSSILYKDTSGSFDVPSSGKVVVSIYLHPFSLSFKIKSIFHFLGFHFKVII